MISRFRHKSADHSQFLRLCGLNYDDPFELGYFSGLISWTFSGSVQQARPGTLLDICNNFLGNYYGTTFEL